MFGYLEETALNCYNDRLTKLSIGDLIANTVVIFLKRKDEYNKILICYSHNCPAKVKTKYEVIATKIL